MNILMISDVYFPRINGVSTSIETFRRALSERGVNSTLIAPAYPGAERDEPDLLRTPSRYIPLDPEDRMMRSSAIRLRHADLQTQGFDAVHIHTPFVAHYAGLEIARKLGLPCLATYHTFFEEYLFHYVPMLPKSWLRSLARRFSRGQCNAMDRVIVPSRAMASALSNYGVRQPLQVLPTGIPEEQFHGGDGCYFRNRYGISKDKQLLLYVGRVAHEKNISFLLDMVDHLRRSNPRVLLLITGEGPALPSLQAEAERKNLNAHVRFLGYLDRGSELHDCYRAADLFVFASRTETQGLVLLEAMALGTPVVALADMGTRDILAGERGCRIAPPYADSFADLVGKLLDDSASLHQLGEEARETALEWKAEEMAARLESVYAETIASRFPASKLRPA